MHAICTYKAFMKVLLKDALAITKKTAAAWYKADPFRQSAVVAYYAIFSIPPLLVIIIAAAGLAFGREAVQGHISGQISSAIGSNTAEQVEEIIKRASERETSLIATIVSVITLIIGATGVFAQLQTSLNQIWEVKITARQVLIKTLRDRLFSFGLIISICFLLLVSLIVTTALAAFGDWIKANLPDFMLFIFKLINFLVSFAVISVLFGLMFKILPDARIRWRHVTIGSMVTALLFILGKFGLGVYFGKAEPASIYGTAGSIVLIMLWVSYSCMIVFFGAEFTRQFASHYGYKVIPGRGASLINADEGEQLVKEKHEATDKVKKDPE
jgi:membrane protein